jgi:hypothetical protein
MRILMRAQCRAEGNGMPNQSCSRQLYVGNQNNNVIASNLKQVIVAGTRVAHLLNYNK